MGTTPLKTIAATLKLIDAKKEDLRKAFDDEKSNSSSLSSFTLSCSDPDSHFTSIQSSLTDRFHHLQNLTDQSAEQLDSDMVNGECYGRDGIYATSKPALKREKNKNRSALPELKRFCEEMNGVGLREYITERPNNHAPFGGEISDALTYATEAVKLVLDASEGVVHVKSSSSASIRK